MKAIVDIRVHDIMERLLLTTVTFRMKPWSTAMATMCLMSSNSTVTR